MSRGFICRPTDVVRDISRTDDLVRPDPTTVFAGTSVPNIAARSASAKLTRSYRTFTVVRMRRPIQHAQRQRKRSRPQLSVSTRPSRSIIPQVRTRDRTLAPAIRRATPAASVSPLASLSPDPYLDYARRLTPQGGIAITYKDLDLRFRHTLRRLLMWSWASGIEAWFLLHHSPAHHRWVTLACWAAAAIINWRIVAAPVETYRTIEIRPDCMIIGGTDLFWACRMENGWPSFQPDGKGNQRLCGIYGTRFVEYATVHRFDEFDRAPEVLAAHLRHAMQRLWSGPH
jgi:hypothetical protein